MNSTRKGGNIFKANHFEMRNCQRRNTFSAHHGHRPHGHCEYRRQQEVAPLHHHGFCSYIPSEFHHHDGGRHYDHHGPGHYGHHAEHHQQQHRNEKSDEGTGCGFRRFHQRPSHVRFPCMRHHHGIGHHRSRTPDHEHFPARQHHCGRSRSPFRGRRHSFGGRFGFGCQHLEKQPEATTSANIE